MKDNSSDQLHTIMAHPQHARSCFPYYCISLRQNIIQSLSLVQPFFKLSCLVLQFTVRKLLHFRLKSLNMIHNGIDPLQLMFTVRSEYFLYKTHVVNSLFKKLLYSTFYHYPKSNSTNL